MSAASCMAIAFSLSQQRLCEWEIIKIMIIYIPFTAAYTVSRRRQMACCCVLPFPSSQCFLTSVFFPPSLFSVALLWLMGVKALCFHFFMHSRPSHFFSPVFPVFDLSNWGPVISDDRHFALHLTMLRSFLCSFLFVESESLIFSVTLWPFYNFALMSS